jgi:hypothetical protein
VTVIGGQEILPSRILFGRGGSDNNEKALS